MKFKDVDQQNNVEKLLNLNYQEIVNYLLIKYGQVENDYMTKAWTPRIKMIKKGLILHHIDSNKILNLSNENIAKKLSFDYQKSERLVYCNFLEHLILHIKITELSDWDSNCGIEKIYTEIIPKLNDAYSGYLDEKNQNIFKEIIELKNQYLEIIEYIKKLSWSKEIPILTSFNARYKWDEKNNIDLYNKIRFIGFESIDLNIKFENSKLSLSQQKNILKLIQNFKKWEIQKENKKNSSENNKLKTKAKKLAEYYFEQWNIKNNNFKNDAPHIDLKLKNKLNIDQYLMFIKKLLNEHFSFFTYKNDEFEYCGFSENEYDKFLKQYLIAKENKIIYEIKEN